MPGSWGDSTVEVKCVAVVSTAGDPRPALAVEPDHHAVDAGVQIAAQPVVREEGVRLRSAGSPAASVAQHRRLREGAQLGHVVAHQHGREGGAETAAARDHCRLRRRCASARQSTETCRTFRARSSRCSAVSMWALAALTSCLDKAAKRLASRRTSLPECGGSAMGPQDASPGRDNGPLDAGVQVAAAAVVHVEGVQLGQQGHGPRA
jgi:hypothetical protein